MTTIAWDGTTLAGDRCSWSGGTRRKVRKVFKIKAKDGETLLVGLVGQQSFAYQVVEWLKGDRLVGPVCKDFGVDAQEACALIINSKRKVFVLGASLTYNPMLEKIFSIGAGCEYAWGALEAGATAKQAIQITAKRSDYSALGADCITF